VVIGWVSARLNANFREYSAAAARFIENPSAVALRPSVVVTVNARLVRFTISFSSK
jgi:hypothetical protein